MIFWPFTDGYFAAIAAQPEAELGPPAVAPPDPDAALTLPAEEVPLVADVVATAVLDATAEGLLEAATVLLELLHALKVSTIPMPTDTLAVVLRFMPLLGCG